MPNRKYLFILIIPAVLFITLFLVVILKSPKSQTNTTSIPGQVPSTFPTPTPTSSQTELQSLYNDIVNLDIQDPKLTPPNFDRKIMLSE